MAVVASLVLFSFRFIHTWSAACAPQGPSAAFRHCPGEAALRGAWRGVAVAFPSAAAAVLHSRAIARAGPRDHQHWSAPQGRSEKQAPGLGPPTPDSDTPAQASPDSGLRDFDLGLEDCSRWGLRTPGTPCLGRFGLETWQCGTAGTWRDNPCADALTRWTLVEESARWPESCQAVLFLFLEHPLSPGADSEGVCVCLCVCAS